MAPRLVPLNGGPTIVLDKPIVLIGRHPDCDAVIPHSGKVSRRHCCICQVNETYFVRDLGSMNGVRVNGTRVMEGLLNHGDQLSVGDVPFSFFAEAAAQRTRKSALGPVSPVPPQPSRPTPHLPDVSGEVPVPIRDDSGRRKPVGALSDSSYGSGSGLSDVIPLDDDSAA